MQRIMRVVLIGVLGVSILGIDTAKGGEARRPAVLQVPDGAGATAVARRTAGRAGETFVVDVYLSNIADLGAYQIRLKASGGTRGSLTQQSAMVDRSRKDFVFGADNVIAAVSEDTGIVLVARDAPRAAGTVTVGKPRYVGTFNFLASADAKGVFSIMVEKGPDASILTNAIAQTVSFEVGKAPTITIGAVPKRSSSGR